MVSYSPNSHSPIYPPPHFVSVQCFVALLATKSTISTKSTTMITTKYLHFLLKIQSNRFVLVIYCLLACVSVCVFVCWLDGQLTKQRVIGVLLCVESAPSPLSGNNSNAVGWPPKYSVAALSMDWVARIYFTRALGMNELSSWQRGEDLSMSARAHQKPFFVNIPCRIVLYCFLLFSCTV